MSVPHPLARAARLLDNPVVAALVAPRHVDDYLELVSPTLSLRETRARVTEVRRETRDAVTLVLAPNHRFEGFEAGQYVPFTVELDGRRHTRCFSLSSAPESGRVEVTIKAREGGRVSVWANTQAKKGDVVVLGAPAGDFVLPAVLPARFLFVAGGSGVTPIASLIESLLARRYEGEIACVVYARSAEDTILARRLEAFAAACPKLTLRFVHTRGPSAGRALHGRFTPEHLAHVMPAFATAETYVCGPAPLVTAVSALYAQDGLAARLHVERFALDVTRPKADGATHVLTFRASGVTVRGGGTLPLLEQAERAGLSPMHGCRRGICHTCTCVLERGAVDDLASGERIDEPGQRIRLCTTVPASDVTLAL